MHFMDLQERENLTKLSYIKNQFMGQCMVLPSCLHGVQNTHMKDKMSWLMATLLILYRVVQHLIGATLFQQVTEDRKGKDVKEGHR